MSDKPYKRAQGEFELRVLKDGRLVMIAPDETLFEIGQTLEEHGRSEIPASDHDQKQPPRAADERRPQ